ncbi:MAG: hypothetical protein HY902_01715 [Deltaproteobacteria bacterium]|nr:hypothetical protein [Deltaproteobacteria bacterium]
MAEIRGRIEETATTRPIRRCVAALATWATIALSACGNAGGGGGGGGGVIGAPGTACNPASNGEVCLGSARMLCDPSLTVWTQLAVCPPGSSCVLTSATTTFCTTPTADATSSGSDASGSDSSGTPDTAKDAAKDAQPDTPIADTKPADTSPPDTGDPGDTPPQPTGPMTISEIQQGSVACPSPDPPAWNQLPGVTITGATVVTSQRKLNTDGTMIGMYVQQGSGQWSGLFVVGAKDGPLGALNLGDVVNLTGDVKDYYCLTEMYVTAATTTSVGQSAQASAATLYQVGDSAGPSKSEGWEGALVELHNLVAGGDALGTDGKPHGDFWVGMTKGDMALRVGAGFPGVYTSVKQADGTFLPKYPAGTMLGTVRGVIDYNFGTFRLLLTEDPLLSAP